VGDISDEEYYVERNPEGTEKLGVLNKLNPLKINYKLSTH
jgi:hypothetical protein